MLICTVVIGQWWMWWWFAGWIGCLIQSQTQRVYWPKNRVQMESQRKWLPQLFVYYMAIIYSVWLLCWAVTISNYFAQISSKYKLTSHRCLFGFVLLLFWQIYSLQCRFVFALAFQCLYNTILILSLSLFLALSFSRAVASFSLSAWLLRMSAIFGILN